MPHTSSLELLGLLETSPANWQISTQDEKQPLFDWFGLSFGKFWMYIMSMYNTIKEQHRTTHQTYIYNCNCIDCMDGVKLQCWALIILLWILLVNPLTLRITLAAVVQTPPHLQLSRWDVISPRLRRGSLVSNDLGICRDKWKIHGLQSPQRE